MQFNLAKLTYPFRSVIILALMTVYVQSERSIKVIQLLVSHGTFLKLTVFDVASYGDVVTRSECCDTGAFIPHGWC